VGSVYLAICSSNTPVSLWLLFNGLYNLLLLTSFCLVLPLLLCCGLQGQSRNIKYIFRPSGTVSRYLIYLYIFRDNLTILINVVLGPSGTVHDIDKCCLKIF
jgi:hypothetical protein